MDISRGDIKFLYGDIKKHFTHQLYLQNQLNPALTKMKYIIKNADKTVDS